MEGSKPGKGSINLVIKDREKVLVKKELFHLELKDIKKMYEHFTVGDVTTPRVAISQIDPDNINGALAGDSQLLPVPEEEDEKEYVLFVHGWRMEPWERRAFAETSFKRLFWLGYNGRFGFFSWPTEWVDRYDWGELLWDLRNYDRSEVQAWRSGKELVKLLKQISLNYPGKFKVFAHSMGNIVVSEALKELSSVPENKNIVSHYAACQAASVADAYNASAPAVPGRAYLLLDEKLNTGPDLYSLFPHTHNIDGTANTDIFFKNLISTNNSYRAVDRIINMYNKKDSAVASAIAWPLNQETKPDLGFSYDPDTGYRENGKVLLQGDYDKILAHICIARSRALGAESGLVGDVIDEEIDMGENGDCGFTDADADHSAQFVSYFAKRRAFWLTLAKKMKLKIKVID